MLYTRKGDRGTTKLFNSREGHRVSKSDFVFEALGTLDELNSTLGYARALCQKYKLSLGTKNGRTSYCDILEIFQQNLFFLQAELAGSHVRVTKEHVLFLEGIIYEVETLLPPIKSFIIPGGGEAGAYLDIARTIARRAEREFVSFQIKKVEKAEKVMCDQSAIYLNRLSSALYALARLANYQTGYLEKKPEYK